MSQILRLSTGRGLSLNQQDPNWTISGPYTGPAFVQIVSGPWEANTAASGWITPPGDLMMVAVGDFTYTVSFDLTGVTISQLQGI